MKLAINGTSCASDRVAFVENYSTLTVYNGREKFRIYLLIIRIDQPESDLEFRHNAYKNTCDTFGALEKLHDGSENSFWQEERSKLKSVVKILNYHLSKDPCVLHQRTTFLFFAGIQPAELRGKRTTLSQAWRAVQSGHLLHSALTCPPSVNARRLKSRHPFVPAPHNNSSVHLTTTTYVRRSGRITDGMRSDCTTPRNSVL